MRPDNSRCRRDEGVALVMVLLVSALVLAMGQVALTLTWMEVTAAAALRDGDEAFYAADAAVELGIRELAGADLSAVLSGGVRSTFFAGTTFLLSSGTSLDAGVLTAELQADSDAATARGADNPRWRLFASGALADLAPGARSPCFIVVWVGDDGMEGDGAPGVDTNGVVRVRGRGYGLGGSQREIDAIVGRTSTAGAMRLLSWKEVRG